MSKYEFLFDATIKTKGYIVSNSIEEAKKEIKESCLNLIDYLPEDIDYSFEELKVLDVDVEYNIDVEE